MKSCKFAFLVKIKGNGVKKYHRCPSTDYSDPQFNNPPQSQIGSEQARPPHYNETPSLISIAKRNPDLATW